MYIRYYSLLSALFQEVEDNCKMYSNEYVNKRNVDSTSKKTENSKVYNKVIN